MWMDGNQMLNTEEIKSGDGERESTSLKGRDYKRYKGKDFPKGGRIMPKGRENYAQREGNILFLTITTVLYNLFMNAALPGQFFLCFDE